MCWRRCWRKELGHPYLLWTDEGWMYLAVVLDLFNREVIGWSMKPRMTTDIVVDSLKREQNQEKLAA